MERYFIAVLIVLILHCNDVKISVVKISEIVLIMYGLYNYQSFHKTTRSFFYLFTFFLVITLVHNLFMGFDYSVVKNILQEPYWCSIGRYVELLCCLAFVEMVMEYVKKTGVSKSINMLFRTNAVFGCILLVLYVIEVVGISNIFNVALESGRMTGFFNEGGPFGLLLALQIVLSLIIKRPIWEIMILAVLLFLSASKAGAMLLLLTAVLYSLYRSRTSKSWRYALISLLIPFITIVGYAGYKLVVNYGVSWADVEYAQNYSENNPDDLSFVAGRVSGRYIGVEMIKKNPIIGIGLGNYPITRNLNEYRTFFPKINIYDASGLGGIFDLVVQQGLLGAVLFFLMLHQLCRKNRSSVLVILFVCVFLCGVQLTFVYPWLLIAMNEVSSRCKKERDLLKIVIFIRLYENRNRLQVHR